MRIVFSTLLDDMIRYTWGRWPVPRISLMERVRRSQNKDSEEQRTDSLTISFSNHGVIGL